MQMPFPPAMTPLVVRAELTITKIHNTETKNKQTVHHKNEIMMTIS